MSLEAIFQAGLRINESWILCMCSFRIWDALSLVSGRHTRGLIPPRKYCLELVIVISESRNAMLAMQNFARNKQNKLDCMAFESLDPECFPRNTNGRLVPLVDRIKGSNILNRPGLIPR